MYGCIEENMNALTKDLMKLTEEAERKAEQGGRYRQKFHLMPPTGWLNDPNGLCQYNGVYHAFFQYSPFNPEGGVKMWGHCTSEDMTDWKYEGVSLYPDQPFDCHGVYSGAAYVEDGAMYLYYTGNVKLDGDYDYIGGGREANTCLTVSRDGYTFGRKEVLMKNKDYPSDLTLHVRDPKVWKEGNVCYMIQGARRKDNAGLAVLFRSEDKRNWAYCGRICTEKPFGYMWECPDYFVINGRKILSASVQGLTGGAWEGRNVYQSGWFFVDGEITDQYTLSEYRLWDYGFDYYAPQSFETEDGRRIQIGWMGMPDCEEYTNRTIEEGWQHCFTFPREIFIQDGRVCQRPVRELGRRLKCKEKTKNHFMREGCPAYQAYISGIRDGRFRAVLAEELVLEYRDGRFEMRFSDQSRNAVSAGRGIRYAEMETAENVRILADVSSVEVFVNDGRYVFSTRYYPGRDSVYIDAAGAEIEFSCFE